MSSSPPDRRRPRPDIELAATVKAHELRFDEVPDPDVRFSGEPDHDSSSGSERNNLPDSVEPGVSYRDVTVHYRLASRLVSRPNDEAAKRGEE